MKVRDKLDNEKNKEFDYSLFNYRIETQNTHLSLAIYRNM